MAFNFNWSPLRADAEFYRRARDLLTTALNKSPKPPIIVGDILVTEFNLGSVPPDLEILEIGDLAEDRFRGIFRMCYAGDAYVTLKTRVQANPLNTYLDSKPSFTSPQPLAASSSLIIPLSITLSAIRLSAFIILVFSRKKGLTLVFRNDPLESLKVSSTFDSIQFVRDYLQRTIETNLRTLMMDELPAIIHQLSLQLWCPDQLSKVAPTASPRNLDPVPAEPYLDPLATFPFDPVDTNGNLLDPSDISQLSLSRSSAEVQSLFSEKNILRLSVLSRANLTLSLSTPPVLDVLFRAWSGPAAVAAAADRLDSVPPSVSTSMLSMPGPGSVLMPTGAMAHSAIPSPSAQSVYSVPSALSDSASSARGHLSSRPSQLGFFPTTGLSLGSGNRSRSYVGRKKKTRVVNLRRPKSDAVGFDLASPTATTATSSPPNTCTSLTDVTSDTPYSASSSVFAAASEPLPSYLTPEALDHVLCNVALSPSRPTSSSFQSAPSLSSPRLTCPYERSADPGAPPSPPSLDRCRQFQQPSRQPNPPAAIVAATNAATVLSSEKDPSWGLRLEEPTAEAAQFHSSSAILEQAWIMKMAGEIARRVYEEKHGQVGRLSGESIGMLSTVASWEVCEPPPAYETA